MQIQAHLHSMKASPRAMHFPSFFYGLVVCGMSSIVLGILHPGFEGNLLALLSLSGSLALSDFMDALRGKRDVLSARALVSALMFHTTYVTPLMHLGLDSYPRFLVLPDDMETAFFNHAVWQALCVSVYFLFLRVFSTDKNDLREPAQVESALHLKLVFRWLIMLGIVSAIIFVYVVMSVGGPISWLNAQLNYREGSGNPGWIIALAEAFPSLFFMAYLIRLSRGDLTRKQVVQRLLLAAILIIAITFISSGLRGSRANLVWPALTIILMIHILFYRFKLKILAILVVLGMAFAGLYNIYKKEGLDGVQNAQEHGIDQLSSTSDYSFGFENVLMGDFSRSGIQAVVLDRWNTVGFTPYYGVTYIGDVLLFLPGSTVSTQLPNKSLAATDILYGSGAAKYTDAFSTRIYGLQGEALMNFGPVGSVLVFIPFAYIVGRIERLFRMARQTLSVDSAILYAVLIPALLLLYLSDLDNVLRNITSNVLLPAAALLLASFEHNRVKPPHRIRRTITDRKSAK